MEEFDFKKDTSINPGELDIEWLRQADLYRKYSGALTDANDRVRKAEQQEKFIRSKLSLEAVRDPDVMKTRGSNNVSATAANVEAYYRTHPDHVAVKEELLAAMKEAEALQNAVYAITQKKTALENLVRLQMGGYFAGPTAPRDLAQEWSMSVAERKEHQHEETVQKMRTRRQRED